MFDLEVAVQMQHRAADCALAGTLNWRQERVTFNAEDAYRLLTDYLALRAIVEEVAMADPIASDDQGAWCVFCKSYCEDYDGVVHDQCLWLAARALVGPTAEGE